MFTELLRAKPAPVSVTEPFGGPDVGAIVTSVPKLVASGLPIPVTKS